MEVFRSRYDWAFIRRRVFERDKGVCARCSINTEAIAAQLESLRAKSYGGWAWTDGREAQSFSRMEQEAARLTRERLVRKLVADGFNDNLRSLWEAHHKTAVALGGGGCGPENIETLCVACHKKESKALVGLLARQRRARLTLGANLLA